MNGRVLSDDEIQMVESRASLPYFHTTLSGKKDVLNLIATIRDRDKTIAELTETLRITRAGYDGTNEALEDFAQQNTILREALEWIANGYLHGQTWFTIASEALAKVGESK